MDSLELLWRPLVAGVAVVCATGALGVFLLWRRMAYFGDALSHSALLGVALGIVVGVAEHWFVLGVGVVVASIMVWVQHNPRLGSDTMLGILGHSSLALGLIALHFSDAQNLSVESYLFGDILLIQTSDVYWSLALSATVLAVLWRCWDALLIMTVHQELAQAEGTNTRRYSLVYMLLIALVVAMAMQIVGVLLLTALLIIPAAAARKLSNTPEQMVTGAIIIGVIAVFCGLSASWWLDTPTGPSIVVAATSLFVLTQFRRL